MLFLMTTFVFLIWAVYVIRKGRLSWHTLLSIYFLVLFIVDMGDASADYWFKFYDLSTHLLNNSTADNQLAVVFSDAIIFPLIAIVFCYYTVRYHRPWLLSLVFAMMLGTIEFVVVQHGYMHYHHWYHWVTPVGSFLAFRFLAHFSERLISYNPPVSYRVRLFCVIFAISEWPGATLGGVLHLYMFRPHIFEDAGADDRFVAVLVAITCGAIAVCLITRIPKKYRLLLFLGLGVLSSIFGIWAHSVGLMLYNHWNNVFTIIRYMVPYLIIYFYDHWESGFTSSRSEQTI